MSPFVWPAVTLVAVTTSGLALTGIVSQNIDRGRTSPTWPGRLVAATRLPALLWSVVLGLVAVRTWSDLSPVLSARVDRMLEVVVIAATTITLASVIAPAVAFAVKHRAVDFVTRLAQTAARLVILGAGLLMVLRALGLQIGPMFTALGIGGLAVALALQNTLSNLFAGMQLLADEPIRVGDLIRLSDGVEGFVVDVWWRSTRLRTLTIKIGVDIGADAARVETALQEEAMRAVGEIPGLLPEPQPCTRLTKIGDWSLEFSVFCQVATFLDQYEVQHQLHKRFLGRLRTERIEFPVPLGRRIPAIVG